MRRNRGAWRGALAAAALLALGCGGGGGGGGTPTAPSCVSVAGSYNASFNNSCGASGDGIVTVAQAGCSFSATLPSEGTATGTLSGRQGTFALDFESCGGSAAGEVTVAQNGTINGTYEGNATGAGCCGNVSGSFTLRPR